MVKKQQKHEMLTYAIAKDGCLVHIDEVKTGQECACTCPACGESLIAKNRGAKRVHHFAHKSGVECEFARESMLHLLAKERVQEAFLKAETFLIDFEYKSYCFDYERCKYTKCGACYTKKRKIFNLKEFYDSCEQEVKYDGIKRRSDLKFFSSTDSEREPVYIEFCVTHASEQEKLHSGSKIIECLIECEEDIEEIVKSGFVEDIQIKEDMFTQPKPSKIQFYGFRNSDSANAQITSEIAVNRCSLYKSGKMYCDLNYCNCKGFKSKKSRQNSLYEVCFHTNCFDGSEDEFAKCLAYARFHIPNCFFCKNYVVRNKGYGYTCRYNLHVKKVPFIHCDTSTARNCSYYTFSQEVYDQIMQEGCGVSYDEIF